MKVSIKKILGFVFQYLRLLLLLEFVMLLMFVVFTISKQFVVYADDFGVHNDAYYCEFIPTVGVFLGDNTNLNVNYDSNAVFGVSKYKIAQYNIRDLTDIYVGDPHRKDVALQVGGPPGQEIVFGFWGYNYAGHDIKVAKVLVPLTDGVGNLSSVLSFNSDVLVEIKDKVLRYRLNNQDKVRKDRFIVKTANWKFETYKFYTGFVIAKAKIKPAVEVTQHETTCMLESDGEQLVQNVIQIKNNESVVNKIRVIDEYTQQERIINVDPGVTQSITYLQPVEQGTKQIESRDFKINVLNANKQCINVRASGLDTDPKTKNVFVLRDDLSYSNTWLGFQPGFGVPYANRNRVLCVTRIPYGFSISSNACSFPVEFQLHVDNDNNCVDLGKWQKLTVSLENLGIQLHNIKVQILPKLSDGLEDSAQFVEFKYAENIQPGSLQININTLRAFENKNIDIYYRVLKNIGNFDIEIQAQDLDNSVTHSVTISEAGDMCDLSVEKQGSVSVCKEVSVNNTQNQLYNQNDVYSFSAVAKLVNNKTIFTSDKKLTITVLIRGLDNSSGQNENQNIDLSDSWQDIDTLNFADFVVQAGYFNETNNIGDMQNLECSLQANRVICDLNKLHEGVYQVPNAIVIQFKGGFTPEQHDTHSYTTIQNTFDIVLGGYTTQVVNETSVTRCSNDVNPNIKPQDIYNLVTPMTRSQQVENNIKQHNDSGSIQFGKNYDNMFLDNDFRLSSKTKLETVPDVQLNSNKSIFPSFTQLESENLSRDWVSTLILNLQNNVYELRKSLLLVKHTLTKNLNLQEFLWRLIIGAYWILYAFLMGLVFVVNIFYVFYKRFN